MQKLIATLFALSTYGLAFAETGEVPQETVGMGGIIAFFVVSIVLVVAFVMLTNKNSKKTDEERAGDKLK
ncbi:MAG: hypothetical protein ACKVQK_28045 [Burkholderiales bacterium]